MAFSVSNYQNFEHVSNHVRVGNLSLCPLSRTHSTATGEETAAWPVRTPVS